MTEDNPGYITVDKLMKGAEPCSLDEDVRREIEQENILYRLTPSEVERRERAAAAASIMSKIIGAEGPYRQEVSYE